jgi:cytoskeleton protein RodZ
MDGHDQTHTALHSSEETLQHLRITAGLDVATLARKACLSVAQIQQLENGQSSSFYSEAIRTQASRRVMAILKAASQSH